MTTEDPPKVEQPETIEVWGEKPKDWGWGGGGGIIIIGGGGGGPLISPADTQPPGDSIGPGPPPPLPPTPAQKAERARRIAVLKDAAEAAAIAAIGAAIVAAAIPTTIASGVIGAAILAGEGTFIATVAVKEVRNVLEKMASGAFDELKLIYTTSMTSGAQALLTLPPAALVESNKPALTATYNEAALAHLGSELWQPKWNSLLATLGSVTSPIVLPRLAVVGTGPSQTIASDSMITITIERTTPAVIGDFMDKGG